MEAIFTLGAMLLAAAPEGIAVAEIIGAVVMTAFTALSSLIFAPSKPKDQPFEPTQYTKREIGGTLPVVVGKRRVYGVEVFRKNDSSYPGASSRQFMQINYSVGPVAFICDTAVYGEKNIFDLGHKGAHTSVIDYRYGTPDQLPTGFGWSDIAGDPANAKNAYDSLGLKVIPNIQHPVSYSNRAGINIFMAADEQGRSQGMNVADDSLVYGLLCRRFKDTNGYYLCHVGDHNKYAEFYYDSKRYTGVIVAGTYTATELAAATQVALNGAEDDDGSGHSVTFSVSYDSSSDKFTISADTADIRLLTWTGSHRGADIWDELGIIRGARYGFDPTKSGGNDFDDIRLEGDGPYTVATFEDFSYTKTFTRNPIRICYELRTNLNTSPGVEHPDDFEQSLMYAEEQYCNGIVTNPDGSTQYDIQPTNILPVLKRVYGSDGLITGTVAKPNELLKLIDGSRAADAAPLSTTDTIKDGVKTTEVAVPQIVITLGSLRFQTNQVVLKTSNTNAQSYTVQYVDIAGYRIKRNGIYETGWLNKDWKAIPGGVGVVSGQTGNKTIAFSTLSAYAIRIVQFSAVSGNFSLSEVEVNTSGSKVKNVSRQAQAISCTVVVDAHGSGDVGRLVDGSASKEVEFIPLESAPGGDDAYYQITFPFKRTIGLVVLATNVGEPQSYTLKYQDSTGGAWTEIVTRENCQGTDYCFFEPVEMIAFRITNVIRGNGDRPFTITEIEAYDAVPSVRYTLDAVNESGQKFSEFMLRLYESFIAIPCDQYGTRFIRVERDEPAVQELNDDHIMTCRRKPTPRRDMVNQWLIRFSNELKDYESDIVTIDDLSSQVREMRYPGGGTGNVVVAREIELAACCRPMQARRLGNIIMNRARYGYWSYSITCKAGTVIAKLGDLVRINKPSSRINNKYVRIVRMVHRANHDIEIEALEHYSNIYDSPKIEAGDIEFIRDAAGANGGVIPGDVSNVSLEIDEPGDFGTGTTTMRVTFNPPDDPNFSYGNIWTNWDEAVDADGELIYRLEGTSVGDSAYAIPVNASGSVDDEYKIRVVVQAVSKSESRKELTQIVAAWERGENTAVSETAILFDGTSELTNHITAQAVAQASTGQSNQVFIGDGSTNLFNFDNPYKFGTTQIFVDGLQIGRKMTGINDGTGGSPDTYEYEEINPDQGEILFPKNAPANGAVIAVQYARATASW